MMTKIIPRAAIICAVVSWKNQMGNSTSMYNERISHTKSPCNFSNRAREALSPSSPSSLHFRQQMRKVNNYCRERGATRQQKSITYNLIIVLAFSIKYRWQRMFDPTMDMPNVENIQRKNRTSPVVPDVQTCICPAVTSRLATRLNAKKAPFVRSRSAASSKDM